MSSLAELSELVGFFSYSREDDEDSDGALSRLRERIQRELRSQLGRSRRNFRLWQDAAAIAHGRLWEDEIKRAVAESVFFIPIVTPTAVRSGYCKLEFNAFLAREAELGRADLVFPILYIPVAALDDEQHWRTDPVLNIIGTRQYMPWQKLRHLPSDSTEVGIEVERFCANIVRALHAEWIPPPPKPDIAAARRAEEERAQQEAQAKRRAEEPARAEAEEKRRAEALRRQEEKAKERAEAEARRREARERPQAAGGPGAWLAPTWSDRTAGILLIVLGCAVLAWFSVYAPAGLSWGPEATIVLIVGTIVSGIALFLRRRYSILTSVLIGVPVSVLGIAPWAPRFGELFDLRAFTYRTSLTTAWLLIVCYVLALAFFVWRAWQLREDTRTHHVP
jgi:hypothetical protein